MVCIGFEQNGTGAYSGNCSRQYRSTGKCYWDNSLFNIDDIGYCRSNLFLFTSKQSQQLNTPLIVFENVAKHFGDFVAVKELNLSIDAGEFIAIMGPSGCGKTTTLRMLAGLDRPSNGSITIDGQLMNDVRPHQRDTPLVWQSLALFPFLNARENVEFGLKMRNQDPTKGRPCSLIGHRTAIATT